MDYKNEVEWLGKVDHRGWKSRKRKVLLPSSILSKTEPEKFRLNLPAPSGKAKYYWVTDSELVPWGKGEKNPDKGSEIDFETMYLQTVEGLL